MKIVWECLCSWGLFKQLQGMIKLILLAVHELVIHLRSCLTFWLVVTKFAFGMKLSERWFNFKNLIPIKFSGETQVMEVTCSGLILSSAVMER